MVSPATDIPAVSSAPALREGVVAVVLDGRRFLIVRRALHLVAGGAWCFVGGGIEPGESEPEALTREFQEEVAGVLKPVRKLWTYSRPDGGLRLHWWLGELASGPLIPNPAEVIDLRWLTVAEIHDLPNVLPTNLEFLRRLGGALPAGA